MSDRQLRRHYAELVTRKAGSADNRIISAFETIPREQFCGAGPWQIFTPTGFLDTPGPELFYLYQDTTIALARDRLINNGEPSLHARCLAAVDIKPGEHVIHVGAGSGYYTAILGQLAGAEGRVDAFEIESDLAELAQIHLAVWPTITVHARSGTERPLPDADVIYVSAGATEPLRVWLEALLPGGRLLFPLTPDTGLGALLLVTKTEASSRVYPAQFLYWCAFIPCMGARTKTDGTQLAEAFQTASLFDVKSLRLNDRPDDSCWYAGQDWWLSMADAMIEI